MSRSFSMWEFTTQRETPKSLSTLHFWTQFTCIFISIPLNLAHLLSFKPFQTVSTSLGSRKGSKNPPLPKTVSLKSVKESSSTNHHQKNLIQQSSLQNGSYLYSSQSLPLCYDQNSLETLPSFTQFVSLLSGKIWANIRFSGAFLEVRAFGSSPRGLCFAFECFRFLVNWISYFEDFASDGVWVKLVGFMETPVEIIWWRIFCLKGLRFRSSHFLIQCWRSLGNCTFCVSFVN